MLHPLLLRQLKRSGIEDPTRAPDATAWARILERIGTAYREADEERYLLERSLSISSAEMLQLNASLRASEASLAAERDKLRAVISALGEGLCVLDGDGCCRLLNPEGERVLGWTEHEVLGGFLLQMLAADALDLRTVCRDDDAVFTRKDGSTVPVSYVLDPMLRDGETAGAVLAFRDISERKRVQQALDREYHARISLIANAPVAMAMFDREMRYVTHSERWLEDYGLQGQSILGRSQYDVFPDIPERWREAHARGMQGESLGCPEDVFERADGSKIYLRWAIQPWTALDESVGGIIIVAYRVDDLVKAREAALESARLKAEFLANMSHEIRTPMNGIIGTTDLLLETELTRDQRDHAVTIQASAENLLTLVNDVLDFSKIEAGKLRVESIDLDPRAVVQEVVELLAETVHRKGLEIGCRIATDVPGSVRGDPARLRQTLTNLVGNAIKFTSDGEVVVSLRVERRDEEPACLRFEVRDTGIGIPKDTQSRLFQAFSQADGSTTRKFGGTGLGLAISRRLVLGMGGSIGVESAPGAGSLFWFEVPLVEGTASDVAPLRPAAALLGARVLVLDDNDSVREILRERLETWGLEVALAVDSGTALQTLRDSAVVGPPFDIALLDTSMPGGGEWLEIARILREDQSIARTKTILLTTTTQRARIEAALGSHPVPCLTKPVRESRLLECLNAAADTAGNGPEPAPPQPRERAPSPSGTRRSDGRIGEGLWVLLVEDNAVNRGVGLKMLERLGFSVEIAQDGRKAVAAVGRNAFDVILMDCQMPEMDGFEATAAIRAAETLTGAHVPIVAMTANVMSGDRERCLAAGMDDYIPKPVKLESLARVLGRCLAARSEVAKDSPSVQAGTDA